MLTLLRYIFSVLGMLFAAYGLITQDFSYAPFMMLFLGLMMFIIGLEEFKKERKAYGYLFVTTFLFSLYVSIQGFILG